MTGKRASILPGDCENLTKEKFKVDQIFYHEFITLCKSLLKFSFKA